jgi:polar amino acid transport system substrate-binding protein
MKALCLTILLTFLALPALAAGEKAYESVVANNIIRCGYGISPPVLVKDPNTGKLSGLDYEIWNEIGKELGLKIEWVEEAGWGNFIEGLKTGRYDAFCTEVWPDPARSKFLSLTDPVIFSFLEAYSRSDDVRFDGNLDKINDSSVKIPAIEGDVSVTVTQNGFPKAGIDYLPQTATVSDMFMSVISKKSDVIFIDQAMIAALDKSNKSALRKVKNVPPAFTFASYYGVLAGEYQLRDMVNLALRTMKNDGRLEKLAKKYSASYIVPKKDF